MAAAWFRHKAVFLGEGIMIELFGELDRGSSWPGNFGDCCLGFANSGREGHLAVGTGGGGRLVGQGRLDLLEADLVGGEQHANDEEAEPRYAHDQKQDPGDYGASQLEPGRMRTYPGERAPAVTAACPRDAAPGPLH